MYAIIAAEKLFLKLRYARGMKSRHRL